MEKEQFYLTVENGKRNIENGKRAVLFDCRKWEKKI